MSGDAYLTAGTKRSMYDAHYGAPAASSTVVYRSQEPVLSSTPILQPQRAQVYQRPVKQRGAPDGMLNQANELFQQIPRPSITLPAVGLLLILLNHLGTLFRLLFRVGFIDCAAIACVFIGATIATQHLRVYLRQATQTAVTQLLQMADSKVMLTKIAEVANSHPAPAQWLEMYITMVGDISGLHQENVKMRTIMAGMQADIDHLKSKGKYIHPVRTMYRAVSGHNKKDQPGAIPE